jgi:hypothetical protein
MYDYDYGWTLFGVHKIEKMGSEQLLNTVFVY